MLRKLFFLILLVILGAGVGTFWFWRQVTYLPDWYTQNSEQENTQPTLTGTDVDDPQEINAMRADLEKKVSQALTKIRHTASSNQPFPADQSTAPSQQRPAAAKLTHEVALDATGFNELVLTSVPQTDSSKTVLTAIKAINTEIVEGELKTGLVLDTNQLALDKLPAQYRSSVETALQTFPFLNQEEVYVGLVGQPRLESGRVVLDQEAQVQVGSITLSLADLADQFDIPLSTLEQSINLQIGELNVQDIDFSDQKVILRGAVN